MIIKVDVTNQCNLDDLYEVKRVFNCYQANEGERTFCCSATPMVFCQDLGHQLEFGTQPPDWRVEEIENEFNGGCFDDCYLLESLINSLPRVEWGEIPPEGAVGCVIQSPEDVYETAEDEVEDFFASGG
jgi:hypothetical protein